MKIEQSRCILKREAVDNLLNSVLFLHFLMENTIRHGTLANVNIEASNTWALYQGLQWIPNIGMDDNYIQTLNLHVILSRASFTFSNSWWLYDTFFSSNYRIWILEVSLSTEKYGDTYLSFMHQLNRNNNNYSANYGQLVEEPFYSLVNRDTGKATVNHR